MCWSWNDKNVESTKYEMIEPIIIKKKNTQWHLGSLLSSVILDDKDSSAFGLESEN